MEALIQHHNVNATKVGRAEDSGEAGLCYKLPP